MVYSFIGYMIKIIEKCDLVIKHIKQSLQD